MSVCPYCGSDMYNIDDGIKCDMCGYIIRSDLSEDFSEIEMDEDYINEFETIRQRLSKMKTSKFDEMLDKCGITTINNSEDSDYVKAAKEMNYAQIYQKRRKHRYC